MTFHFDYEQCSLQLLVVWPNKPMVPTAPASPAANPLLPMRRHIGQPLGSGAAILGVARVVKTPPQV